MINVVLVHIYIAGEPDQKFGKVQGWKGTEGLTAISCVKIAA